MGKIHLLPPGLVNLIAAGEVVERPASVVKELLENALDAGATRIAVDAEGGGIALLRVADDGGGMAREDLPLAVRAHATSKLAGPEDLGAIATYGFRGEALASIGAVAVLRVTTSDGAAGGGSELVVEVGRVGPVRALGRPRGTTVEARELFATLPARRRFLRTPRAEFAHVAEAVERAALAHPDIEFVLTHDGRDVLRCPRTPDWRVRAAAVLGDTVVADWRAVSGGDGGARVEGLVAPAGAPGRGGRELRFFVNGRPVRDRGLSHAVHLGYRERLPRGSAPAALLFVTLPAEGVDVNVHPTKSEVRFHDPGAVHDLVAAAVDAALGHGRPWGAGPAEAGAGWAATATAPAGAAGTGWAPAVGSGVAEARRPMLFAGAGPVTGTGAAVPATAGAWEPRAVQVLETYLLEEVPEGLVLTDQHALHERLLLDELLAAWATGPVARQALLVPLPLAADRRLAAAARTHAGALTSAGLECAVLPGDIVLVQAVPAVARDREPAAFAAGVLADLADDAVEAPAAPADGPALDAPRRKLAATIACHAAVVAGHRLAPEELRALLRRRGPPRPGWHCAHGRPAVVLLPHAELQGRFCRHRRLPRT